MQELTPGQEKVLAVLRLNGGWMAPLEILKVLNDAGHKKNKVKTHLRALVDKGLIVDAPTGRRWELFYKCH